MIGPAFFERLSLSNLANAGLRTLAVDKSGLYVKSRVAAGDRSRPKANVVCGLRATIRRSPLGVTRQWVRDFEALALHMSEAGAWGRKLLPLAAFRLQFRADAVCCPLLPRLHAC